ncbi:cold-shock protein [Streptomyces roseus]|uniref:cold-shock protein n=1 Tax=Streptomyces roseus TaxID=66430 RepID=UPI00099CA4F2|nr:cold shock domain-containing protein [Streptomyces roseus]
MVTERLQVNIPHGLPVARTFFAKIHARRVEAPAGGAHTVLEPCHAQRRGGRKTQTVAYARPPLPTWGCWQGKGRLVLHDPRRRCRRVRAAAARCSAKAPVGAVTPGSAASRPCSSPPHRQGSGRQWRLPDPTRAEGGSVSPCGVVKWFDPDRGVGLIRQEGGGPDVQAEASALHGMDRLRPGEVVLFNVTLDGAGLRADNIHRPARSEAQPPAHGRAYPVLRPPSLAAKARTGRAG